MNSTSTDPSTDTTGTPAGIPTADEAISYRDAEEFDRQEDRRVEVNQQQQWLRVFEDGHGVPRAGLYDSPYPHYNDHWADGEAVTDETDAAMVEKTLEYPRPETRETVKTGSPQTSVGRLRRDRRVGEGCWPARATSELTAHGVHLTGDGRGAPWRGQVRAE